MSDREINNYAKEAQNHFQEIDKDQNQSLSLFELEYFSQHTTDDRSLANFLTQNYHSLLDLEDDDEKHSQRNDNNDGISGSDLNTLNVLSDSSMNGVNDLALERAKGAAMIGGALGILPAIGIAGAGVPGPGWVIAGVTGLAVVTAGGFSYLNSRNYYAQKQNVVDNLQK